MVMSREKYNITFAHQILIDFAFSEVKFDIQFQRYAILKYESICREIQSLNITNQPYFGIISLAIYPWQFGYETVISEIKFW